MAISGRDRARPKGDAVRIRVDPDEREAFERSARMSGLTLSAWVRMAAREMAARQYANVGERAPWVK